MKHAIEDDISAVGEMEHEIMEGMNITPPEPPEAPTEMPNLPAAAEAEAALPSNADNSQQMGGGHI